MFVQDNLTLSEEELRRVYTYHIFTFYSVLRLEKYPMEFNRKGVDLIAWQAKMLRKSGEQNPYFWIRRFFIYFFILFL